ncbi:MAG: transketolase C-terminal domain-containing protein, partial [Sheuella sp.]|nr:transketolase C-terminal domain-containing protein [Sheuella sp.]
IHDVALQNLDVTFALDRAGLVGADGATHAGNYDIAFLRCIPNMVVATPSDENECRQLLSTCYQYPGPASVRYPRGAGCGAIVHPGLETVPVGRGIVRRRGSKIAILVFGTLLPAAMQVAQALDLSVVDMRFVKPIDADLVREMASTHEAVVTLEEGCVMGGAGSAVAETLNQSGQSCPLLQLGLPDLFIDHGEQGALLAGAGLDAAGIERSIRKRFYP